MPKLARVSALCVALLSSALSASSLTIVNPDFSVPPIPCSRGYAYQGAGDCNTDSVFGPFPQQDLNGVPGIGWTFLEERNGITAPNTAFDPPSFAGLPFSQAAFLQGDQEGISQSVSGFVAGESYVLSFYLGSRYNPLPDGNQTVAALLGGNLLGTWVLTTGTPFTLQSVVFTAVTTGTEVLEFAGLVQGDHTAFFSHVEIESVESVPEPASLSLLAVGLAGLAARRKKSAWLSRPDAYHTARGPTRLNGRCNGVGAAERPPDLWLALRRDNGPDGAHQALGVAFDEASL